MSKHIPICTQISKIILNHKCFIFMVLNTFFAKCTLASFPYYYKCNKNEYGIILYFLLCLQWSLRRYDVTECTWVISESVILHLRIIRTIWGPVVMPDLAASSVALACDPEWSQFLPDGWAPGLSACSTTQPLTALHVTAVIFPLSSLWAVTCPASPSHRVQGRQLAPILTHILLVLVLIQVLSSYYSMTLEFLKTCYAKLHTKKRGTWGGKIRGTAVKTVPVHHVKKKTYGHIFAY